MTVLFATLAGGLVRLAGGSPLNSLTAGARESFLWAAASTPQDSRFAIVTRKGWAHDAYAEWFPALAGRRSAATVQGTEWLSRGRFDAAVDRHEDLQQCADRDLSCIADWEREYSVSFTHLAVITEAAYTFEREECCRALLIALEFSPQYTRVYDRAGVAIFERRSDRRASALPLPGPPR